VRDIAWRLPVSNIRLGRAEFVRPWLGGLFGAASRGVVGPAIPRVVPHHARDCMCARVLVPHMPGLSFRSRCTLSSCTLVRRCCLGARLESRLDCVDAGSRALGVNLSALGATVNHAHMACVAGSYLDGMNFEVWLTDSDFRESVMCPRAHGMMPGPPISCLGSLFPSNSREPAASEPMAFTQASSGCCRDHMYFAFHNFAVSSFDNVRTCAPLGAKTRFAQPMWPCRAPMRSPDSALHNSGLVVRGGGDRQRVVMRANH